MIHGCNDSRLTNTDDRWFQWFSPSFDPSVMDYMCSLLSGACLLLYSGSWVDALARSGATITGMTPSALASMHAAAPPQLRLITPCGEPLPVDVGTQWAKQAWHVLWW